MGYAALIMPMIPGVIWLWIIYRTDWYEPEPKRLVLATFGLGILRHRARVRRRAAGRARSIRSCATSRQAAVTGVAAPLPMAIGCFLVIGPCEELAKFLAVRLFVYRNKEFNEPLDGIIYAAAAALGFASLENVLYVIDWHTGHIQWGALGIRSLLALPGHVIFAHDLGLRARAAEVRSSLSRVADGGAGGAAARALRLLAHVPPDAAAHPALHVADGADHRAADQAAARRVAICAGRRARAAAPQVTTRAMQAGT